MFFFLSFLFCKIGEQEDRTGGELAPWKGVVWKRGMESEYGAKYVYTCM
jgi:hypothetical protein